MSVPKRLRSESDFELTNRARAFLTYVYRLSSNHKAIPRRYKCTIGRNLIDAIQEFCKYIGKANSIRVRHKSDCKRRLQYQSDAYGELETALSIVMSLDSISTLNAGTRNELYGTIYTLGDLLEGWMRSEEKRMDEMK